MRRLSAIWFTLAGRSGARSPHLTKVLHVFYSVVGNYGIAIIVPTVVVRLCMFPLSRKQAHGAENAGTAAGDEKDQ